MGGTWLDIIKCIPYVHTLMNKLHFLFYGNSSLDIGSGHIMRLFALAQCIQKKGIQATFCYKECLSQLRNRLHQEGFNTVQIDGPLSTKQLLSLAPTHLVIDDYLLSHNEWQVIANTPLTKIIFDDALQQKPLPADWIINTAPGITEEYYHHTTPKAQLCLGPSFALLRQEFSEEKSLLPSFDTRKQILITMGGADVKGLTLPICSQLLQLDSQLQLSVISGSTPPKDLKLLAKENSNVQLYINSNSVAKIMTQAGLAIAAAGNTMYELACMELPTIAVICAPNQEVALRQKQPAWYHPFDFIAYQANTYSVSNEAMVNNLCVFALKIQHNKTARIAMHHAIHKAQDGKGAQRIVEKICSSLH